MGVGGKKPTVGALPHILGRFAQSMGQKEEKNTFLTYCVFSFVLFSSVYDIL